MEIQNETQDESITLQKNNGHFNFFMTEAVMKE